jgi:hypothetical protein
MLSHRRVLADSRQAGIPIRFIGIGSGDLMLRHIIISQEYQPILFNQLRASSRLWKMESLL